MKTLLAGSALALIAMSGALHAQEATEGEAAAAAAPEGTSACLITKTETNPFFVKMREGAEAKAAELGITLNSYAGREDGDHESQVQAIETCIANGVSGILLAASDTAAIVDSVQQARDAGILVIALDTPLNPIDAADATFATDNFKAGELIGQWAKAQLGDAAADAKIAFLDLDVSQPTVDVLRNVFFAEGTTADLRVGLVQGYDGSVRLTDDDRIVVRLGDDSQVIPFSVARRDHPDIVSYGFIHVPGFDDAAYSAPVSGGASGASGASSTGATSVCVGVASPATDWPAAIRASESLACDALGRSDGSFDSSRFSSAVIGPACSGGRGCPVATLCSSA